MRTNQPRVELLWWEACPSWGRALGDLRDAMEQVGLNPDAIELREVATGQDAERAEFVGSPTIRVAGRDVQPPGPQEVAGLTCRVYRLRDGRFSPVPDPADVRDALRAAVGDRAA